MGRQTHPCSVASGVINSVLPGGPPPNICNLKIQKFKPTVCRSEAKVREAARYTAPCCPDAVTASEMSLSIISGLHPLVVFSPVVTIKYGRAVVNRTRESTFHMNPAWRTRSGCRESIKNPINTGRARQDGRVVSFSRGPCDLTTGHLYSGSRLILLCGKSCCCGNAHCLDCAQRNGWLVLWNVKNDEVNSLKKLKTSIFSLDFFFNLVFWFLKKLFSWCEILTVVLCVAARWRHFTGLDEAQVKRFTAGALLSVLLFNQDRNWIIIPYSSFHIPSVLSGRAHSQLSVTRPASSPKRPLLFRYFYCSYF